mmetsp:Transcript_11805/g.22109  ORF Transcript_11805/g.22109 Transcript_11805/m.22109 type:complete len:127 (+) Transcript_11805:1285-1665(+)
MRSSTDFNTCITILCKLTSEKLVEFSIEASVSDELVLGRHLGSGGHHLGSFARVLKKQSVSIIYKVEMFEELFFSSTESFSSYRPTKKISDGQTGYNKTQCSWLHCSESIATSAKCNNNSKTLLCF